MIHFTSITRRDDGNWDFTWADTGASFYRIILWGMELDKVSSESYIALAGQNYVDYPPPLEVVSENEKALSEIYQPYLLIQWYSNLSPEYRVEQLHSDNVSWVTIKSLDNSGEWVYSHQTKTLLDLTTYTFRVFAVDAIGNDSPARTYIRFVNCPPVPPNGTISITYENPNIIIDGV